jgi:hypothetical protein
MFGGMVPGKGATRQSISDENTHRRMKREEDIMAHQINVNEVVAKSRRGAHSAATENGGERWRVADGVRFLFKGQCYDAGPASDTTCSLCGEHIRLCYVLKVLEAVDLLSPEVGKLTVGECCFQPIEAANEKLHRQLLAAAVNLRTYIEAIERDKRIIADRRAAVPDPEEDLIRQLSQALLSDGGDHA